MKEKKEKKGRGGAGWIQSALCENCLQAELKQQGETEEAAGKGKRKTCVHMLKKRWRSGGSGEVRKTDVCSYADQQSAWEDDTRRQKEGGEGEERENNKIKKESNVRNTYIQRKKI